MSTSPKSTTKGRNSIDIRRWTRDGVLTPGTRFVSTWTRNGTPSGAISVVVNEGSVRLIYQCGDADLDYPVMIDSTPCNYGGRRHWWLCPSCGRRVALLYAGKVFSCRHCQQLSYASDRVAKASKPFDRADKLRMRLGWTPGVANPQGDKPKGMHWRTFERELDKLHRHSVEAMAVTGQRIGRIKSKLAGLGLA